MPAGDFAGCSFCILSADGRYCVLTAGTGGMCCGLPAFSVLREFSRQAVAGL